MNIDEQILDAAKRLAMNKQLDRITVSDLARETGLSWPTVRRYVGSKEQLKSWLGAQQILSEQNNPDTRTRIIDAAERIFARFGFSGTTLDEVASDAGLTKGAVYWHFKSKSDLYFALLEERIRYRLAGLPDIIENLLQTENMDMAFASILKGQFAQLNELDRPRLFFEFVANSRQPEIQERLCMIYRIGYEKVRDLVQQMQEEGVIVSDRDPHALSIFFTAVVDGLVLAYMIDPERINIDDIASEFAQTMWRGIEPKTH